MPLPLLTYELSGWKGLNSLPDVADKDPHYVEDCQNVDFDDNGIISKRRGVLACNMTFSQRINFIYDFQSQQGFTGPTDRQRVLVVAGATLNVLSGFGLAGSTLTTSATFSATAYQHYGVSSDNGVAYISNEGGNASPKMLCYVGGSWVYRSAELDAPASAPSLASGSTGSFTGTYSAVFTYLDAFGNESDPSPDPAAGVSLTANTLNMGLIASSDPTVNAIGIYVLVPGTTVFKFSCTTTNTSSTFSVSFTDAQVAVGDSAPEDHNPCPKGKYVVIYNDMLVVGGDPTLPDLIYASNSRYFRQFSLATDFDRVVTGDGQPVKGFGSIYGDLVIGKGKSLHLGSGADNTQFHARPYNQEYGVLGQPSITFFRKQLAFFSDDGIYSDSGAIPIELSRVIRETMRKLNPANLSVTPPKQCAANFFYYKKLFWSVREATGAGENDTILIYNYEQNTWTRYKGIEAITLASIQAAGDYRMLYGATAAGAIYQFAPPNGGSPNSDQLTSGTTSKTLIDAYVETPWINLPRAKGEANWEQARTEAAWVKIYAGGEPSSGATPITLTTTLMTDFSTTVRGTYTTTHSAAAWPTITCDRKKIVGLGATLGTFEWLKLRIANAVLDEHFKIHKLVFGFRVRPAVET